MKRLFIKTFGCQMNVRDSEEVTGLLLEKGYARADSEQNADVILYNTCSIREHAEHRVWSNVGALKALKAARPGVIIGVMGCMAKARREEIFRRMPHVDFISGPAQLYEVPELIESIYEERRPMAAIQDKRRSEFQSIAYHTGAVSALVTIMEGCDKVCSYCVVPYTRGPEVSRPPEQVIGEVEQLARQGYREVMLLGQNVNSYGKRLVTDPLVLRPAQHERTRVTFPDLLGRVNAVPGIERVRFITSHPWDAVEDLFNTIRDLEKVCEHLHLPVQSGSDGVLERMRRGYTAEEYLKKLVLLRSRVPEVAVTTDLIVGFPGETEADFEATVRLVEQARFDSAFIFTYSPRPFAAASRWGDDVPGDVKDRRLQALLALQERITREESEKQLGQTVEVLVEEPGMGRSRQNRKVYFEPEAGKAGEIVQVRAKEVRGQSLIGNLVRASTSSARTVLLLFGMVFGIAPVWAAEELGSLQAAFLRGEYEKVLHASGASDGLLYLQGVSALKLGDQEMARSLLTRLVEQHPDSSWSPLAWLALGGSWEASGNSAEALKVYSRYLEEGRDDSVKPQMLLRIGMIQRESGRWDEARQALQSAATQGTGTAAAAQASEVLKSGEFYFCVQVGAFATPSNAERLAAELKRRGYSAEVSRTSAQGRTLHRVRIGRFTSRSEAEMEAQRLKADGFPAKVFP